MKRIRLNVRGEERCRGKDKWGGGQIVTYCSCWSCLCHGDMRCNLYFYTFCVCMNSDHCPTVWMNQVTRVTPIYLLILACCRFCRFVWAIHCKVTCSKVYRSVRLISFLISNFQKTNVSLQMSCCVSPLLKTHWMTFNIREGSHEFEAGTSGCLAFLVEKNMDLTIWWLQIS